MFSHSSIHLTIFLHKIMAVEMGYLCRLAETELKRLGMCHGVTRNDYE